MKAVSQKLKIGSRALLTVFIILSAILTISGYWEFQSRRTSVLNLMAQMSRNLSITIQKAAVNSIHSYDVILNETTNRLFAVTGLIAELEERGNLTDKYLSRLIEKQRLNCVCVYDGNGAILFSSEPAYKSPAPEMLHDVLAGEVEDTVINIQQGKNNFGKGYTVAVHRRGGGAIVLNIDTDQLLKFRREIGVGNIINSIATDSAIIYIGIQDSIGILAASLQVDSLSSFQGDPFLLQTSKTETFQWRITQFQGHRIFEGILPFWIEDVSYGVIRIGLDYYPIQTIQMAAIRQGLVRFGLLLVVGLILFGLSISIQNIHLLEREKDRITVDVYRLQADLRQKEKLSAMGELAAGVAHEIKNPLNAISMSVQRLGKEFVPSSDIEEQKELIHTIRKEINRISDIIRQFLKFARPGPLQKQWFYLDELIKKVIRLYEAKILAEQITLHLQLENKLKVLLDADKIRQALVNLLENAFDAGNGSSVIDIRLEKHHRQARLIIRDNGAGITAENLPKIFNLYFTTKDQGTGFGLAQVYQVISEHEGSIDVNSSPNQGTEFIINLPINKES
jgi:signal transduction histidine kinase